LAIAQNDKLFEQANALYNEGKYQEAINNYLKIAESKEHSSSLYYNLGNSYYKLNQTAPSIYYYEKALQLSPNDKDIKNNLIFAQNMTVDAFEVLPQTGFSKIIQNIIGKFSYDSWSVLSIIFMVLFVTFFLLYYFSVYQNKKRLYFAISLVSLLICLFAVLFAFNQNNLVNNQNPAIVFAQEIGVNAEPNNRSEEVFTLHEGTKINVEDSMGEWKKIKIADGKTGWLPSSEIKEIKKF
jgi:tetratricopeptide (TPR) repeat protein